MTDQILNRLPNHLKQFIVDQQFDKYTAIDHAVWRYIMRQNVDFLKDHAHPAYIDGLKQTGISLERIPSIEEMNSILGRIGWGAVAVDGFIPPAAFMEFQAHRVLVVACDIRQLHHIDYTPAPDIVHEAAGHAPIIIELEYAEYLRRFGEVGAKAMSSKADYELYEAIRHLSILKEAPGVSEEMIKEAEEDVNYRQDNLGEPSEMAFLSRLHWWTVEYGLIGEINNPLIYGAGLLSSIGESVSCLDDSVKKLPYNLSTKDFAFDITSKQPQLFVTKDFKQLSDVLEKYALGMAFKVGGLNGLNKAIECENISTAVYSSGVMVTGKFSKLCESTSNTTQPIYFSLAGPVALSCNDKQLAGHGRDYHIEGFGSPVGRINGFSQALETASDSDLEKLGIICGQKSSLEFKSGVNVSGRLDRITRQSGQIIVMTFSDCTVTLGDDILFNPEWGTYDMAVGERIISVFSGAADKDEYDQLSLVPGERTIKVDMDEKSLTLISLYQQVRNIREKGRGETDLIAIWKQLRSDHPDDWLLQMEILELLQNGSLYKDNKISTGVAESLRQTVKDKPELKSLIENGLRLLDNR